MLIFISVLKRGSFILFSSTVLLTTVCQALVAHAHVRRPHSSACTITGDDTHRGNVSGNGVGEGTSPATEFEPLRLRPFSLREL